MFDWEPCRSAKADAKLCTLLDLRGSISQPHPSYKRQEARAQFLDDLVLEAGAFCLINRVYLDFVRLFMVHAVKAFFMTRAKCDTQFMRRYWHPVDWAATAVLCDQTGVLTNNSSIEDYPAVLRRAVADHDKGKHLVFSRKNLTLASQLVTYHSYQGQQAELYL